jgi:hypothetical protein
MKVIIVGGVATEQLVRSASAGWMNKLRPHGGTRAYVSYMKLRLPYHVGVVSIGIEPGREQLSALTSRSTCLRTTRRPRTRRIGIL